jgi:hypothetical protein
MSQARERDIERAWAIHDPARTRIPIEARRAAKALWDRLAPDVARLNATYGSPEFRLIITDWARKKGVGRERALGKIKTALAPAVLDDVGGVLRLLWFEARGQLVQIDHPSFKQNCLLVVAACIGKVERNVREVAFPVLETPSHALARMYQRAPKLDAKTALIEAATAFLHADRRMVEAVRRKGSTLCLKAGPGLLLCEVLLTRDLEDKKRLIARANTWVSDLMAEPDQRGVAPAIDPHHSVLTRAVRGE